jgi:Xaa-Pro dipeptidase
MTFYEERLKRLGNILRLSGLDGLAINAGPDLVYFTGLQFHLSERPVILLICREKDAYLYFPEFEMEKVNGADIPLMPIPYPEDRSTWPTCLSKIKNTLPLKDKIIGVNPTSFRFLETDLFHNAFPESKVVSAQDVFSEIRQTKDGTESANIIKAIDIAQNALENTLAFITIGKTEREIANELVVQLLKAGSDAELPFQPIVAAGENSANPHAIPSDRLVKAGDLVLIDWGARWNGYCSDLTRTFAMTSITSEFIKIAEIVKKANQSARNINLPSLSSHQLDHAARDVIAAEGYGNFFIHRTGHGIGLEAHEEPYIQDGGKTELINGMVFTIEPGIYLPKRGGVRIEDNVMVKDGCLETLTTYPREIKIL